MTVMEAPGTGGEVSRRRVTDAAAHLAGRDASLVRVAHTLPGTESPRAGGRRRATVTALLGLADVVSVLVVLLASRQWDAIGFRAALATTVVALSTWVVLGLHRPRFRLSVIEELPRLAVGVGVGLLVAQLVTATTLPAALLLGTMLLLLTSIVRLLTHGRIRRLRASGRTLVTPAILFGRGTMRDDFQRRVCESSSSGLSLVGLVDADDLGEESPTPDHVVVHDTDGDPVGYLGDMRGGALIVVDPGGMSAGDLKALLRSCHARDVETWVASPLDEMAPMGIADDHIAGMSIQRVRPGYQRRVGFAAKRAFDVAAASLALLLLSPVLAAVALAVRLELGRGVLFRQERVGLNGELFTVLKFRSMPHADSPRSWGAAAGDASIGPVGRFIRRFSLDELPQLFNILRGDMSVVGPRPEQPRFVEEFSERFPGYSLRHRVPVGLTGLAAVEGLRGNTSLRDRVHYDNVYIENWSIWLDVKILMRTVVAVVTGSGE
ncbi:exopolysaccharide biosynthesis polyprenyl glycosylphosphotransferase [Nocardioidaceae bacterium]|nr:exopolysaccharide biosynthesis polyprenyl glycosylphosphotransferase [Nocardioidaceae bacterium]